MIGDVTITPVVPPGDPVIVGRTDDPVKLGLTAGWQDTGRPRRLGLTEWQGWPLATMSVPFVLDGWLNEVSVEPTIVALYGLVRELRGSDQPPVVALAGPVDGTTLRWVLQSIDWGDEIRRASDAARIRAYGTLNFLEYSDIDLLVTVAATPAAAAVARAVGTAVPTPAPGGGTGGPGRTYTVRSGDTLGGIARSQLGNASRWVDIAHLNGIRDPRTIRPGQVLRLP